MPAPMMKLLNSASDQNVYFTYMCLLDEINDSLRDGQGHPSNISCHVIEDGAEQTQNDKVPIRVEKSKALHELIESRRLRDDEVFNTIVDPYASQIDDSIANYPAATSSDDSETENYNCNPKILKLTRMNWLSQGRDGAEDASSPSLSPSLSPASSHCSLYDELEENYRNDRYLSTILRLDKEHNMFGLSNFTIIGSRLSKKVMKDDDKPVFYQTAIVQVCKTGCCRNMSQTDLPSSLKCGGCRGCANCLNPICSTCCAVPCGRPCKTPCKKPCPAPCIKCPKGKCKCKFPPCPIPSSKCVADTCCGLEIKVHRKPKYEPQPVELTPRSSCILQKPFSARSCHHLPRCVPPSSCFPYLMPCFWPARPSAPCSEPARCFHTPPCPPRRKPHSCVHPDEKCPRYGAKCDDASKKTKCTNLSCIGHNNPDLKAQLESKFGANARSSMAAASRQSVAGKK